MRYGAAAMWLALGLTLGCTGTIGDRGGPGANANARPNGGGVGGAGAAGAAGGSGSGEPFTAFDSVARRLSQAEIDNTLRDLLGDTTRPASKFLLEDQYKPYDNDYTVQEASSALIDALEAMAEDVATRMLADPTLRARLVPCTPASAGDAACFRQVVEAFGRSAFRRPLVPAEVDAYLTLLSYATENNPSVGNDFYTAVNLLVRSVLQDPEFLYRIEVGKPAGTPGIFTLDSHEVATRLSYLIWGSLPDDTLRSEADKGVLGNAADRRAAAVRMLGDDRAREQVNRFHGMWLGYRAIPASPALTSAFHGETTALIERVVFEDKLDYLDLFRFGETYVDATLAANYGLPAPAASGSAWVSYGDTGRAGILSHGSVLAAFSKFSDTSPTQRGIFVLTRLMCQTVGRPPANVNVDQPPGKDTALCKYDRYAAHRTGSCATCHGRMDPIGFGLEKYDIAGRLRDHDEGHPECTIAGQGTLPGGGDFSGPAELGQRLIATDALDACAVKQYLTFAAGHELKAGELTASDTTATHFRDNGRRFQDMMLDFIETDAFALRKEPEPTP
jgi:Protein of unknown function (DUF1588)/Protein of unknown function (DUF1592)/Protein of unknown function (DUF1595)/Protein of unknown function (DUF1585)/Protein of unknown function (DUF1587)